jgi:hypothetical protein
MRTIPMKKNQKVAIIIPLRIGQISPTSKMKTLMKKSHTNYRMRRITKRMMVKGDIKNLF